ncbi:unnamed protein product [Tuber aestivum]|uniref:HMG box domain-containing protein n=1 Tax=Tuber aestivum TaxID=59557 RepID=A0A292Q6D5_9PEZI|nr:unnamed protein product [Tuber aestivum]
MSTLTALEMAIEAEAFIHQRYGGISFHEYLPLLTDGTFCFEGSDGAQLQVSHMLPTKWKPTPEPLRVSFNPSPHTIVGTHLTLHDRPVYKLSDGSILVVSDPTTSPTSFQLTDITFDDPQHEVTNENRFLRFFIKAGQDLSSHEISVRKIQEKGIKRPANAFILFRTERMGSIKSQYPGIGNNDIFSIAKILGRMWRDSPDEAKEVYKAKARQLAISHKLIYPNYKYTPRRPYEILRRLNGNVDPEIVNEPGNTVANDLGALTQRFIAHPTAATLNEIIAEAGQIMSALGYTE